MSEILFGMRWTTYAFSKFQSARGASHYPAFMGNCWLQMLALADPKRMVCKLIRNHVISHPNHFAKKVDMKLKAVFRVGNWRCCSRVLQAWELLVKWELLRWLGDVWTENGALYTEGPIEENQASRNCWEKRCVWNRGGRYFQRHCWLQRGWGHGNRSGWWEERDCICRTECVFFFLLNHFFYFFLYIYFVYLPNKAIKNCRVTIGRVSLPDLGILKANFTGTVSLDFTKAF